MKHVVITGANRGIGLGLVKSYLQRDARVLATARDLQAAAELQELQRRSSAREIKAETERLRRRYEQS